MPLIKIDLSLLPKPAPVKEVTMVQARLALFNRGMLDTVDEIISLMPIESQRKEAQIQWEFSTIVARDSALVYGIAGGLGLSDEEIDELFQEASKL